jgi:hypothetical protein
MSWAAQWPSHRAPSVGTQLTIMDMAAVSMSIITPVSRSRRAPSVGTQQIMEDGAVVSLSSLEQWPSHGATSVGTQLNLAAVSLSIQAAVSRSRLPRSLATQLAWEGPSQEAVSVSEMAQWPSHRAPSVETQLHMGPMSMSTDIQSPQASATGQ